MKIWIKISELVHDQSRPITLEQADKILIHHIEPVNRIRIREDIPIWASLRSGLRSIENERAQGRPPTSEHLFLPAPERGSEGLGAVDWTTTKTLAAFRKLISGLMAPDCPYLRIAYYPRKKFVHADYRRLSPAKRFFIVDEAGETGNDPGTWIQVQYRPELITFNHLPAAAR